MLGGSDYIQTFNPKPQRLGPSAVIHPSLPSAPGSQGCLCLSLEPVTEISTITIAITSTRASSSIVSKTSVVIIAVAEIL